MLCWESSLRQATFRSFCRLCVSFGSVWLSYLWRVVMIMTRVVVQWSSGACAAGQANLVIFRQRFMLNHPFPPFFLYNIDFWMLGFFDTINASWVISTYSLINMSLIFLNNPFLKSKLVLRPHSHSGRTVNRNFETIGRSVLRAFQNHLGLFHTSHKSQNSSR